MPLQLSAPLEKDFTLDKSDALFGNDGEPTRITVRQATQAQHERRSRLWEELTQEVIGDYSNPDAVRLIQRISVPEIHRIEAFLTLVGCNILDDDGEPLFKVKSIKGRQYLDMNEREFTKAWGKLPPEVAREIHEKVVEVNPTWGPRGE